MIFAFTRAESERYVRQVAPPEGGTLRLLPHDAGTALARFNRSTGIGASVQPLFKDDQELPAARLDLGPAYSVSANHAKMPGTNIEGIKLIVIPDTVDPRAPKRGRR